MDKETWQKELPEDLKKIIGKSTWEKNKTGCSKAKVFRWNNKEETLYLKINKVDSIFSLEKEKIIIIRLCMLEMRRGFLIFRMPSFLE